MPILANQLYERVQIDLLDCRLKPSRSYRWVMHAVDHYSKNHWAFPMRNKKSSTVASYLELLFQQTGPFKILQCDNGTEFKGEVLTVLDSWGISKPMNSRPYHPQAQGLVERYNGMLKTALDKWMLQEQDLDWSVPLSRIVHQINCLAPRTTKQIPYELKKSRKPAEWEGLKFDVDLDQLLAEEWCSPLQQPADMDSTPANSLTSSSEEAAGLLTDIAAGVTAAATSPAALTSRPPLMSSRPPESNSRPPGLLLHVDDDQPVDCHPDGHTDINPYMANELNVVGLEFYRYGGDGGGRCLLSAFFNAMGERMENHTLAQRRAEYDQRRRNLRAQWTQLSLSGSETAKSAMLNMLSHMGNSGRDFDSLMPAALQVLPKGSPQV